MYPRTPNPSCPKRESFPPARGARHWRAWVNRLCAALLAASAAALIAAAASPGEGPNSHPPAIAASGKSTQPSRLEKSYHERAVKNPQDVEAWEGMATLQVRRGDYTEAIAAYRRALELQPHDRDARMGLARALAFDAQYDAALQNFQEALQEHPGDSDALAGMARVQAWSGRSSAALPIFRNLAAKYPGDAEYAMGLARVETNLHQFSQARKILTALLAAHPRNRDAQLQLAYLDLDEGHPADALRRFNRLISQDPTDVDALKGNVRVAYYRGDLIYARNLVAKIADDNPGDADALLLLANLERALHHPRRARALLLRAENVDPRNEEEGDLENSLRDDARPTLHTSSSFAREVASGNPSNSEDLTAYGYQQTWGFSRLPRSESYLSLAYLPSQSPDGGIQGAVGPFEVLYRQTTYVTPRFTLRGGVGLARFGPGVLVNIPGHEQALTSAGIRPLGFASSSYALDRKFTIDLTATRAAITYTPTAVRLGVMEDRVSAALNYRLNRSTSLRLEPFVTDDLSISYPHVSGLAGSALAEHREADHNRAGGASAVFNHQLVRRRNVALNLGYDGLAYGLAGGAERPYIGVFNPGFYQRHYFTTHVTGKIHGPLGYDISTGTGIQQIEHAAPTKPALLLSPAFTLRVSPRHSLTLGYIYYDSSQALGTLRGNAVRLSTDWQF